MMESFVCRIMTITACDTTPDRCQQSVQSCRTSVSKIQVSWRDAIRDYMSSYSR